MLPRLPSPCDDTGIELIIVTVDAFDEEEGDKDEEIRSPRR